MTELGPVSAHLESELRELARQHGIVVWLDKANLYATFADRLKARADAGRFPFPVRCFRGSFLARCSLFGSSFLFGGGFLGRSLFCCCRSSRLLCRGFRLGWGFLRCHQSRSLRR